MATFDTNLHFTSKLTTHLNANYLNDIPSCSSVYVHMTNSTSEAPCHKV